LAIIVFLVPAMSGAADPSWPPELKNAVNGTATLRSDLFLQVPAAVEKESKSEAAPFVVAKTPPTVQLAFHDRLGSDAVRRRLWSSWGDICVASDGQVYCGIGDHGNDAGGDARCFIYRWNPSKKKLEQIVDVNAIAPREEGQPAWSKVHARIDEGPDKKIYFSCTLNDGNRAKQPAYRWSERFPGGQLYQYDPATGRTIVFANLPAKRCTATSLLDRQRSIWWCNLEAGGGNALWALDLASRRAVFQAPDGSMAFNRSFALTREGGIIFNGEGGLWKNDPRSGKLSKTGSAFTGSPGMRAASRESKDGFIYGITHGTSQLFRYHAGDDALKMLGPNWLKGLYTTVVELSPDELFLYYLPGAHGQAFRHGTPVVQYEIASGRRKVICFLAAACERECDYVPGGTYGVKLSGDGSTLYVNFNGHAADRVRPASMKADGFGLCAFAAISIPATER
jgi:hypothetical protein